ncbi:hypothetical protein BDZ91DRAFT_795650 [Kalaharituber pfeilii]|nr:hypothetical protein BDZ91DRAFT_795650 [Kalaharituber pfeilii]
MATKSQGLAASFRLHNLKFRQITKLVDLEEPGITEFVNVIWNEYRKAGGTPKNGVTLLSRWKRALNPLTRAEIPRTIHVALCNTKITGLSAGVPVLLFTTRRCNPHEKQTLGTLDVGFTFSYWGLYLGDNNNVLHDSKAVMTYPTYVIEEYLFHPAYVTYIQARHPGDDKLQCAQTELMKIVDVLAQEAMKGCSELRSSKYMFVPAALDCHCMMTYDWVRTSDCKHLEAKALIQDQSNALPYACFELAKGCWKDLWLHKDQKDSNELNAKQAKVVSSQEEQKRVDSHSLPTKEGICGGGSKPDKNPKEGQGKSLPHNEEKNGFQESGTDERKEASQDRDEKVSKKAEETCTTVNLEFAMGMTKTGNAKLPEKPENNPLFHRKDLVLAVSLSKGRTRNVPAAPVEQVHRSVDKIKGPVEPSRHSLPQKPDFKPSKHIETNCSHAQASNLPRKPSMESIKKANMNRKVDEKGPNERRRHLKADCWRPPMPNLPNRASEAMEEKTACWEANEQRNLSDITASEQEKEKQLWRLERYKQPHDMIVSLVQLKRATNEQQNNLLEDQQIKRSRPEDPSIFVSMGNPKEQEPKYVKEDVCVVAGATTGDSRCTGPPRLEDRPLRGSGKNWRPRGNRKGSGGGWPRS